MAPRCCHRPRSTSAQPTTTAPTKPINHRYNGHTSRMRTNSLTEPSSLLRQHCHRSQDIQQLQTPPCKPRLQHVEPPSPGDPLAPASRSTHRYRSPGAHVCMSSATAYASRLLPHRRPPPCPPSFTSCGCVSGCERSGRHVAEQQHTSMHAAAAATQQDRPGVRRGPLEQALRGERCLAAAAHEATDDVVPTPPCPHRPPLLSTVGTASRCRPWGALGSSCCHRRRRCCPRGCQRVPSAAHKGSTGLASSGSDVVVPPYARPYTGTASVRRQAGSSHLSYACGVMTAVQVGAAATVSSCVREMCAGDAGWRYVRPV